MRHDHLMLSREAAAKISRALSATKPEMPIQIEPAPRPKKEAAAKTEHKPAVKAEAAPKAAKKSEVLDRLHCVAAMLTLLHSIVSVLVL